MGYQPADVITFPSTPESQGFDRYVERDLVAVLEAVAMAFSPSLSRCPMCFRESIPQFRVRTRGHGRVLSARMPLVSLHRGQTLDR
jgi:hypothetical protein